MGDVRLDLFEPAPQPRSASRTAPPRVRRGSRAGLATLLVLAAALVAVIFGALILPGGEGKPRPASIAGLTFWSGGDSTSYYMSVALRESLTGLGAVPLQPEPEYVAGSGLRSPGFYDWEAQIRDVAAQDPDVVVFMIGANDAQSGHSLDDYRAKVRTMMDAIDREGRYVVWVGQPNMADPERAAEVRKLNGIFRAEARGREWVRYVDTWDATSAPGGAYSQSVTGGDGAPRVIRSDDGLHFTPEGGALLARVVLAELLGE